METTPDLEAQITLGAATEEGGWPYSLTGMIDEVVWWNATLTEAQAAAIYNAH